MRGPNSGNLRSPPSKSSAFGISQQDRKYLRQRWELPGGGRWVAVEEGAIVGYAVLDESHEIGHAAVDADLGSWRVQMPSTSVWPVRESIST